MTDAFLTGLHHALQALAYVAGAGTPVVMVAALVLIALFAFRRTKVTRTAWRLHREARRSGRTTPTTVKHVMGCSERYCPRMHGITCFCHCHVPAGA